MELTQDFLKDRLEYEPASGKFFYKKKCGSLALKGQEAGAIIDFKHSKRCIIGINYKSYYRSQLAFLYMKGYIPNEIDHIDGDSCNDIWENLRECTHSQNIHNQKVRKDSGTGIKGLEFKDGKYPRYIAQVRYKGKIYKKSINVLNRDKDKVKSYLINWLQETRNELHGEFANHG